MDIAPESYIIKINGCTSCKRSQLKTNVSLDDLLEVDLSSHGLDIIAVRG